MERPPVVPARVPSVLATVTTAVVPSTVPGTHAHPDPHPHDAHLHDTLSGEAHPHDAHPHDTPSGEARVAAPHLAAALRPTRPGDIRAQRAAAVGVVLGFGGLMAAYTVRVSAPRGALVTPGAVAPGLAELVGRIQRVPWPQWNEPGARMRREVVELCRLQAARGLTVLSWLADGRASGDCGSGVCSGDCGSGDRASDTTTSDTTTSDTTTSDTTTSDTTTSDTTTSGDPASGDLGWLLTTNRLTGPRQQRMYGAAERLAEPVRDLVIANWTWVLSSAHGGRVTAPFFASRAYPDDGYAAAHATMTLTQMWDRIPDVRQALAAAWAATRTPADWCKAAELQARFGGEVPIFTYPRGPVPPKSATRPWISRLLGCE
jgi:hypothetical protein